MPQRASFTVNDRASTPAAHVFAPRSGSADLVLFAEAGVTQEGERKFTISTKTALKQRVRIKFENPTLVTEVINGVSIPKVARTNYVDATFTFDRSSTAQERKDTVGMFYNSLATGQTMVMAVVEGGEGLW